MDLTIIALYFILILAIGLKTRAKASSIKSYGSLFLETNKLILIATIFASAVGGGTVFGISEKAFSNNIAYSYALLFTISTDLLIAKFLTPKLVLHRDVSSVGDILYKHYGNIGKIFGGIAAALISIGYLSAQINVSGKIFEYVLNIGKVEGVVLSYVIVIIYTTIGGLQSVVFVNLLQFFAMILSIPLLTIMGLNEIGYEQFSASIPSYKYSLYESSVLHDTFFASLNLAIMGFYPSFIQRMLINKNPDITTSAIFGKSLIYAVFIACVTLNGLIAFVIDEAQNSNLAIPYMIDHILPVGVKGFVIVGFLSAVMSTADSDINITSISIVNDILRPIFGINNEKLALNIAKVASIIIGAFGIVLALRFDNAVDLVVFASGFWNPMILVILIFALFNITISKIEFLVVAISGALTFILWSNLESYHVLKGSFVGTLFSFVLFMIFRYRAQLRIKTIQ